MSVQAQPAFQPYLPRIAVRWPREHPRERFRAVPGSLVSLDISGFTSLSERLQAKGRAGAEELILLISGIFEGLIGIAHRHGGDVLKFRGDALLLLFEGPEHELRASHAAAQMQWFIEQTGETMSSVGPVQLRMATGIYSGECHFYLVGSTHRELIVTGPAATETVKLESAAEAGEILVSPGTAAAVDPAWLTGEREGGRLIRLPADLPERPTPEPEDGRVDPTLLEQFVPAPLRAHLALETGEGEHRQVTAAFVKFSGTDDLLAREGPEAVLEQLEALGELVGDTAAHFGITWLESDVDVGGGKLYLVAGAPGSAGDDEERMLRALRRIVDAGAGPTIRAGVNRGPAFAGDIGAEARRTYAVMGDTVNLAARLTARTEPGQILASADVLDRSRTKFETSHQPFLMKGKERPVTAYSVGRAVGAREEAVDRTLPLVGREGELALLDEALSAARMRQTRLVELVAEPGMGKSRLVEEVKTRALGFQQLLARAEAYETSTPYFAFRSLLRPLAGITPEQGAAEAGTQLAPWVQAVMPDLAPWLPLLAIPFDAEVSPTPEADAIDQQFRRGKLHEVVDQFLTRTLLMPTLLVFEDAHWMDDASAFLLRHLMASPMPRPWLVLVTKRPEGEPFSDDPLVLGPLPAVAATQLALAATEETPLAEVQLAALTERSGGNPLFVRELVAAARAGGSVDALPETVETLMTARIDTLDPGDRMLLRYASVVGPSFDLGLLEETLADQPVEASDLGRWERLSEFVEWESGESLHFRHDLFRAAAYEGLSFRRRREIHGRVGEALERRVGDAIDEAAGLLSLHFLEASEFQKAWDYAVRAGRRAQAIYANVVAAELYERALSAAERLPELSPLSIADVYEALGDVSELYARYDRAGEAYGRALELVVDDPLAHARLLRKAGVIREREGRYEDALALYGRALEEIAAGGESDLAPASRIEVEIAIAGVKYRQGKFDESAKWSRQAIGDAEAAGNRSELAHALYLLDIALVRLRRPDSSLRERALAIYEETGELVGKSTVMNNIGTDAYYEYRWPEALAAFEDSRELSRRAGDVSGVARASLNEGMVLVDQGQLERAEELLTEAIRVFRAAGYPLGVALGTIELGRAFARSGRFDEAQRLLAEAEATFVELGNAPFAADARARRAETHVLAGEHREALELATSTLAEVEGIEGLAPLRALLERLVAYALIQGRRKGEAGPHFERSLAIARGTGADAEVALTLKAMADAALVDETATPEAQSIFERLGVISVPRIPLP
jgi:class 3 adenylate cyclase/tetratricopeptide (TPR) repeat protein